MEKFSDGSRRNNFQSTEWKLAAQIHDLLNGFQIRLEKSTPSTALSYVGPALTRVRWAYICLESQRLHYLRSPDLFRPQELVEAVFDEAVDNEAPV
ncbi:hypothetical protein EJB05_11653, partial [Eragrostis curvula]